MSFFVGKILDFIERGSLTHPKSVGALKRRNVSRSYMTSVFMVCMQGVESKVGVCRKGERGVGRSHLPDTDAVD